MQELTLSLPTRDYEFGYSLPRLAEFAG
jgi:hypothetical protein